VENKAKLGRIVDDLRQILIFVRCQELAGPEAVLSATPVTRMAIKDVLYRLTRTAEEVR